MINWKFHKTCDRRHENCEKNSIEIMVSDFNGSTRLDKKCIKCTYFSCYILHNDLNELEIIKVKNKLSQNPCEMCEENKGDNK